MFRTPEFQQRIKLGISQKLLFSNLASGTNLIVNRSFNCSRAVFMKRSYLFLLKTDLFWSFHAFSKKQKLKGKFPDNFAQNSGKLFHVLAHSLPQVRQN